MFDLGLQELLVIAVVSLFVVDPKKLPEVFRTMGKGMAQLKKTMSDARDEIKKELEPVDQLGADIPNWKKEALAAIYDKDGKPIGAPEDQPKPIQPTEGVQKPETDTPPEAAPAVHNESEVEGFNTTGSSTAPGPEDKDRPA